MTAVIEMLCRFEPEEGRPDRGVGRLANDAFALFDLAKTGVAIQSGRATSFAEAHAIACAVLTDDPRPKAWPHTAHVLALALVGGAWSGAKAQEAKP